MAEERTGGQLERWVTFATTFIAPVTLLSALLFYFGYVSSRAQYEYFGVDVDTIGLSTQDYVIRSPQPLLVPLLMLVLFGIAAMLLHAAISRRIAMAAPDEREAERLDQYRRLARRVAIAGLAVLGAGVVLLISYPYVREWALFNLVTPLLLGIGAALAAYASRVQSLLHPPMAHTRAAGEEPRSRRDDPRGQLHAGAAAHRPWTELRGRPGQCLLGDGDHRAVVGPRPGALPGQAPGHVAERHHRHS